jgi:S-formylglutathione hydrolase FrmB
MPKQARKRVSFFCLLPVRLSAAFVVILFATLTLHAQEQRVETIQFKSSLIGKTLPYNAVLPNGYANSFKRYPVLFLLHGLFGNYNDWVTRTNLVDYANKYDVIVVTPEGGDAWYTDSATVPADKFETYIVSELVPDVDTRFRTIKDRRARGIAGLSMGGYGALKLGLKYREQFAFAGSMSGALDPAVRSDKSPGFAWDILRTSITQVFGPENSTTRRDNDLHSLYRNLAANQVAALPYLYFDCGTEDGFIDTNRSFAQILLDRKIPHEFRQLPGGHNWGYWDQQVQEVLRIFVQRMEPRAS